MLGSLLIKCNHFFWNFLHTPFEPFFYPAIKPIGDKIGNISKRIRLLWFRASGIQNALQADMDQTLSVQHKVQFFVAVKIPKYLFAWYDCFM